MNKKQKHIICIFEAIDRIGELIVLIWRARNIFNDDNNKFTFIFPPLYKKPRTNKACFNIVTRGSNIIHTTNEDLLRSQLSKGKLLYSVLDKNDVYVCSGSAFLQKVFVRKYHNKKEKVSFSLSDLEIEYGKQIQKKFGIPKNAPLVTLHVRESGYLKYYHYHNFRDANIENYIPAIQYLIDNGFYVVRLGDKSMKKIVNAPPQLIDAPFHPEYTSIVDPYFVSQSKFFLCFESGPSVLAWILDIPLLRTNVPILSTYRGVNKELVIFKKYFSKKQKRFLSLKEVLSSPAINYYRTEEYEKSDFELVENTPEEILASTKEILARLDGHYTINHKIDEKVNEIFKQTYKDRQQDDFLSFISPHDTFDRSYLPDPSIFYTNSKVSAEYIKLNPHFLAI